MHTAFIQLLNMSYTASWMAVAVILLRLVLKKAPKSLFCAMWALVGVRLVCPFSIESTLSLIPNPKPIPPEILQSTVPQVQTGVPLLNQTINPILQEVFTPQAVATATPLQRVADAAAVVWVVGVLLMVLYTGISAVRLRLRLREAVWLRENIWVCEAIQTPFVFGVFRPRIYLPAALQEADAVYVLAHENAHITRRDHWWKPIGFALLTVYWFNPVMWAAYMLLCRDIELACDEKVIRNLGTDCKKPYSAALINCSVPRKMVMAR